MGISVLPMFVLCVGIIWSLAESQLQSAQDALHYSSRLVSSAVDAQLGKYSVAGQALSASPSLKRHDLGEFRDEAERALLNLPGSHVILVDQSGRQVVNTRVAPDHALPSVRPAVSAAIERASRSTTFAVSDLYTEPVTGERNIIVVTPEPTHDAPVDYFVGIAVKADVFYDVLHAQGLPEGWVAAIIDRNGNLVAYSRDYERWLGKRTLTTANVVSPLSGWSLGVAADTDVLEAPVRRTVVIAGLIGTLVTLASLGFAFWAARTITGPLRILEASGEGLSQHEPVRTDPTGVPEVDRVQRILERTSAQIRTHDNLRSELLRASRLSELGRMAAALAHEINQPLTAVATLTGASRRLLQTGLREAGQQDKLDEALKKANAQALRAGDVIRRLRQYVGTGDRERTIEDAAAALEEATALAIAAAKHGGVVINSRFDRVGHVLVDRIQLQQVVNHLVRNAIEAMDAGPRRELTLTLQAENGFCRFSVSDTGTGLGPEMLEGLFTPFTSTKDQGMGIGLSVCREIIEAHDGKIWAESAPGAGATFHFVLPLVPNSSVVADDGRSSSSRID